MRAWRVGALVLLLGLGASYVPGLSASNTLPASSVGEHTQAITLNDLKPAACAALNLTNLIVGNGNIDPGPFNSTNDLILGGLDGQTIRGRGGDDCILGGGGDDDLRGDGGTDVCIGGPGTDTFHSSCETQEQ